jgi:hypothetical protein
MPEYLVTKGLLKRVLEESDALPEGAQVVLRGEPNEPALSVNYVVDEETESAGNGELVTLADARRFILAGREDGVQCPCCRRLVRVYKRKLNGGMAVALCRLVVLYQERQEAVHVRELFDPSSKLDFSQLRFWGLAVTLPKEEGQHGRRSGYWEPTTKGIDFVYGRASAPSHRIHVPGTEETLAWETKQVHIGDVLPDGFDYDELMATRR